MAKSINLRTRLSLPRISFGGDPTTKQLAAAIEDLQRNLLRWSDALPFGATGFQVRRSNNDAAIVSGAATTSLWNVVDYDEEGWAGTASAGTNQSTFYCPPGLSGWYIAFFQGHVEAAVGTDLYPWVNKVDLAGTQVGVWQHHWVATDRYEVVTCFPLSDGEGVQAGIYNISGGFPRTPQYHAGGTNAGPMPRLTVRRFSLL